MWKLDKTTLLYKNYRNLIVLFLIALSSLNCSISKFSPEVKYPRDQLKSDYSLFRKILEDSHPGINWYTPSDSMNYFFEWGSAQLKDSMSEPEFRKILSYVIAKINCGHTVVKPSKKYSKYLDTTRIKAFPLSLKIWQDTATVAANLNRRDTIFKRGTVVKRINEKDINEITDSLFQYISSDGYNINHKYQTLSNRGGFGSLYTNVFGLSEKYYVDYTDSAGNVESGIIPVYDPGADSALRRNMRRPPTISKKDRKDLMKQAVRFLHSDSSRQITFMDLNSFGRGYGLKKFFKQSFKFIRKNDTKYLVIDVRGNGGGNVTNSTLLSKYLATRPFKVADSLYAINRNSRYSRYIEKYFFNKLFMLLMTKKKDDGYFHFGYFEKHFFKPKRRNHFNGTVYILTGGNSFSATTLFIQTIKSQDNIIVVGEETGGGAYGNTAWLIPDVRLPKTKVRFRLPLFRLVIDKDLPKNGRGIFPDIEARPTVNDIKRGADFKMEKVLELIKNDRAKKL
jgi:peptidase S41-like protein